MNIELINGSFTREEALELITELISTKIRFHEKKISLSDQLEDIQFREKKIKKLSQILKELRNQENPSKKINMNAEITIQLI
jgi:hypothetical protein